MQIMGILNVTPDSFSDGGEHSVVQSAVEYACEMLACGADIIDIGGESMRPGSQQCVPDDEEIARVVPVIEKLKKLHPDVVISVDTRKAAVAEASLSAGADIINDVSGLTWQPEIAEIVAKFGKGLVIMHAIGTPENMQDNPEYGDVVAEVTEFLQTQIDFARRAGVKQIIGDVGIGFGKTLEHNLELLRRHSEFARLNVPMLLGISRKSFIGKLFNIKDPKLRDEQTALIHSLMMSRKVDIIRVHNVELHAQLRKIYHTLNYK